MTSGSEDRAKYQSTHDLPSIAEMEKQLQVLRVANWFRGRKARQQMSDLQAQLDHLTTTVDAFHELLGPRNWIFHESLKLDDMAALIAAHSSDPEGAERALIAWYQDPENLRWRIHFLRKHEGLRARMEMINLAAADYQAGRHYAVVQLLLSVTDGFVNDFDPANRKALHALESDDIDPWDSVVGLHHGLASVHRSYIKTVKKLDTEPVYDIHRHGIVHGMLTNYNNDVVSTKSWNLLFAVADWATSLRKKELEDAKPPPPGWRDLIKQVRETAENKSAVSEFEPAVISPGDPRMQDHPVHQTTTSFLEAWQRSNYGGMARHVSHRGGGTRPVEVKNNYRGHTLEDFGIVELDHFAAAAARVRLKILVDGAERSPEILVCREDDDGKTVFPQQPGDWRLSTWGLAHMLRDAE